MTESNEHENRLAKETSPYLLQHKHNPVDWYPWGPEAFAAARKLDKPIFLSVGYSTCYWCHVMERESFENPAVAAEMNARFINIKVDREERPDVDQLYMTAVQLISRQGGWPMSVFLTPDLRPFYGGTYFPPNDHANRPGFVSLLQGIEDAYKNRKDEVEKSATQIVGVLEHLADPQRPASVITIDAEFVGRLIERSAADYDPRSGGYGTAPKFPRQTLLELLLFYQRISPDARRMQQITHTLDCMAHGGIRDQLGGAFHRYSTDAEWLVPHFEIMLYDNAMLAWCYIEAYRQTEDRRYAAIARGIFDFVLRAMTSPEGAFYTAFDAEVDGQEGLNYLWTRSEVEATLAEALGDEPTAEAQIHRFCRVYGLDEGPNFADPHHGNGRPDQNILYLAEPEGINVSAILDPELAKLREILLAARKHRKQPLLDTKIITSWNALMIRALAAGGNALQEPKYTDAAMKAADFLLSAHHSKDEGLFRTSRDGVAKYDGFIDDYAYLVQAMVAISDNGGNERFKDKANALSKVMIRKFYDETNGGFFFTEAGSSDLIVRQKVGSDAPLPSGNGVAAMALISLDQAEFAKQTLSAFARTLESQAEGMSALLQAAVRYLQDNPALVVEPKKSAVTAPLAPREAAADVVSIRTTWAGPTRLLVHLEINPRFHINAHEASEGLMATQLSISGEAPPINAIVYPPGKLESPAFSQDAIRLYSGTVEIAVEFNTAPQSGVPLQLGISYQACNENACFPLVTKAFEVTSV